MIRRIHAIRFGALIVGLTVILAMCFTVPTFADTTPTAVNAGTTVSAAAGSTSAPSQYTVQNSTYSAATTFKIKAAHTGLLAVYSTDVGGATVTLYSSSGKKISRDLYLAPFTSTTAAEYQKKSYFCVKAGKTYNVKLSNVSCSGGANSYTVSFINKTFKNSSGSSKSKAKTIKRNKTYYAVLPAGSKSSGWMKVRVKKGTFKVYAQGLVDNYIYLHTSSSGGAILGNMDIGLYPSYNDNGKSYGMKYKFNRSATLYLKVYRQAKPASGVVAIKVKQK